MQDDFDDKLDELFQNHKRQQECTAADEARAAARRKAQLAEFRMQIEQTIGPALEKAGQKLNAIGDNFAIRVFGEDDSNPRVTLDVPTRNSSITFTPSAIDMLFDGKPPASPLRRIISDERSDAEGPPASLNEERIHTSILKFIEGALQINAKT
jgi:hypothetical protein